jgi:hypothetical protein
MKNMLKKVSLIILALVLALSASCAAIAEEVASEPAPAPVVEAPKEDNKAKADRQRKKSARSKDDEGIRL